MNFLKAALDFLLEGAIVRSERDARLDRWRGLPPVDLDLPHAAIRYVVVDTETTGADMYRDTLISVGAVALRHEQLELGDAFLRVLRQESASADENILIHGIGGEAQRSGDDPKSVLLDFLDYLGKAPLVAFRAEFDRRVIERGVRTVLGYPFTHPWIDLALLLPALFPGSGHNSLDEWLEHFGIAVGARHNALGDAYATAQLLQVVIDAATKVGMVSASQLISMQKAQRWLGTR